MPHRDPPDVVRIAGAGPAGLSCAIRLAESGVRCEVHERHPRVGGRFDGDHQVLPAFGGPPHGDALLAELGIPTSALDWWPLHEARFFDGRGRSAVGSSERPFAYMIRRGPGPGTLDQALAQRAVDLGVRIHTGQVLPPDRAQIVATGLRRVDGLAIETMFGTSASDRADVLLDETLAPGGYAYLFIREGHGTLGIAAMGAFKDLGDRLQRASELFEEAEAFDQVSPRSAAHGMNFSLPLTAVEEGRPVVGEAAGFQDFLFGLGLRMAMISGFLAAESHVRGVEYDGLWKQELRPRMLTSLVDRWLYERGSVRRWLFGRMERTDLRVLLDDIQKPHWGKQVLLPWIRRARMSTGDDGGNRPKQRKARG